MLCSFNKIYMTKLNRLQVWKWLVRFLFSFISALLSKTNAGLHTTHSRPLISFPPQITLVCAHAFLVFFYFERACDSGHWQKTFPCTSFILLLYHGGLFILIMQGKKRLNRCWKIRSAQSGRTLTVWAVSQAAIQKQKWAIKCRK